jgi:hypothetical protein
MAEALNCNGVNVFACLKTLIIIVDLNSRLYFNNRAHLSQFFLPIAWYDV